MDLLPLIVNPPPQSVPGQPTPVSSSDGGQQFQSLFPHLKHPPASTNDLPPDVDEQNEAETLAALALVSQLVGLTQVVSSSDISQAPSSSSNASLGIVVATGATTPQIPIQLPVQANDGKAGSTPRKPPAGLILNAAAQLLQNSGLAADSPDADTNPGTTAVQNGKSQSSSGNLSPLQIPTGFHPVPGTVSATLDTQAFTTAGAGSHNVSGLQNAFGNQSVVQTAAAVQTAVVTDPEILPVQPVIATNQITPSVEPIIPQVNHPVNDPQLNLPDIVTVSTFEVDVVHPTAEPAPNTDSGPLSGQIQQPIEAESNLEALQTQATTLDAEQNDDSGIIPSPVSDSPQPVVAVQAPAQPSSEASLVSQGAIQPDGIDAPAQGQGRGEIHSVELSANKQSAHSAGINPVSQQKPVESATTTGSQSVVTSDESTPSQLGFESIATTPERRPDDSRTKNPAGRGPIVPIGFAINPHHFAIQTDLKGARVSSADVTERAEAARGINIADLPGASFSTIPAAPPVSETPETTVPVHATRPQEVVPQLTHAIAAASNEPHAIRVELKPEELGHVRIEVQQQDGVMVASIEVERSSTAHLMADSLSQLHDSLQAAGINIERIDLSTVPSQPGGDSLNSSSQWGRSNSQASTQQEQSGFRQPPEQQQRRSEFRRDEPHRSQPTRSRNRILDIDVTV